MNKEQEKLSDELMSLLTEGDKEELEKKLTGVFGSAGLANAKHWLYIFRSEMRFAIKTLELCTQIIESQLKELKVAKGDEKNVHRKKTQKP